MRRHALGRRSSEEQLLVAIETGLQTFYYNRGLGPWPCKLRGLSCLPPRSRRGRPETMAEMTPGAALRQIQQAQAGLKSARKSLRLLRDDARAAPNMLKHGWERLAEAHRILASIPLTA